MSRLEEIIDDVLDRRARKGSASRSAFAIAARRRSSAAVVLTNSACPVDRLGLEIVKEVAH